MIFFFFPFGDKDLEEALLESTASWKIVVGHHTIRSVGHHGDTPELVEKLVPLLKVHSKLENLLAFILIENKNEVLTWLKHKNIIDRNHLA